MTSAHPRSDRHVVALIGNPNVGKSSLFTALTGTRQKIANFPGVTVEAKLGTTRWENTEITVIDLPGTYSLAARSPDERVAIDALLGRHEEAPSPDGVVLILDASSLDRNLYLGTQVLEFGLPTVVALTMVDVAKSRGITVDIAKLAKALGVPVVEVNVPAGRGIEELKATVHRALHHPGKALDLPYPAEFKDAVDVLYNTICDLSVELGYKPTRPEAMRLLVDLGGPLHDEVREVGGPEFETRLMELRARAATGKSLAMVEAAARYGMIGNWMRESKQARAQEDRTRTDRIDAVLTHRLWGSLVFVLVMGLIFISIYKLAEPLMTGIEVAVGWLGGLAVSALPADTPMLHSLVQDGVVGGVGGVLVFLPQILILFFFIAVLEDLGYMSRAAFLMDRIMARFGLSGRSFIPLLGSFACNIPGVMGARVIEDRNTRLTTIFLAPFMSCSARLPVYTLMIAAFVPARNVLGWIPLQGLVLFAMYWVGVAAAIPTALVLKRGILKSKVTPFLMEMPSYKMPRPGNVARVLWERGGSFVKRAGTIILAVSVVVWAALWFPRSADIGQRFDSRRDAAQSVHAATLDQTGKEYGKGMTGRQLLEDPAVQAALAELDLLRAARAADQARDEEALAGDAAALESAAEQRSGAFAESLQELRRRHGAALAPALLIRQADDALTEEQQQIDNEEAAAYADDSILGRLGHTIEPLVRPLGWDWRIGMAAIASFPAREVVVGTLGTIFSLGDVDEKDEGLREVLRDARDRDGKPLFTLATGLSVMVFFALCCQCAATLAVMRRETNSWKWPLASFSYMTVLAYLGALVTFQVARALGG